MEIKGQVTDQSKIAYAAAAVWSEDADGKPVTFNGSWWVFFNSVLDADIFAKTKKEGAVLSQVWLVARKGFTHQRTYYL